MCLLLSTPYQQVQHHPETILEDVAKKLHRPILHLMDPQIFGLLLNSFTQTLRSFGLPFSISSKTKVSNILLFLSGQLQLLLITSCLGPIHKWYSIFWAIFWPTYPPISDFPLQGRAGVRPDPVVQLHHWIRPNTGAALQGIIGDGWVGRSKNGAKNWISFMDGP